MAVVNTMKLSSVPTESIILKTQAVLKQINLESLSSSILVGILLTILVYLVFYFRPEKKPVRVKANRNPSYRKKRY